MTLNRNDLIAKLAKRKTFYVKELEDEVLLKKLLSKDVMPLIQQFQDKVLSQEEYTYKLVVMSVVDEKDDPLFDDEIVRSLPISVITELAEAVAGYNGMDIEKAKADLKKVPIPLS